MTLFVLISLLFIAFATAGMAEYRHIAGPPELSAALGGTEFGPPIKTDAKEK